MIIQNSLHTFCFGALLVICFCLLIGRHLVFAQKVRQQTQSSILSDLTDEYLRMADDLCRLYNNMKKLLSASSVQIEPSVYERFNALWKETDKILLATRELLQTALQKQTQCQRNFKIFQKHFLENFSRLEELYAAILQEMKKTQEKILQFEQKEKTVFREREQTSFFKNCSTKKEQKRRYRELIKKYHPDNFGDATIFLKIQKEYQNLQGK